MKQFTAAVTRVDGWRAGWIELVRGVNCQERTKDQLRRSLKVTLQEPVEDRTRGDLANRGVGRERKPVSKSM